MAVFPDRIVLKASTDPDVNIRAAIAAGGVSEIIPGEIVVGRRTGSISLYSVDAVGAVREIGSSIGSGTASIGRGDGGDFDTSQVLYAFVFGVYGGGDFDATLQDLPIELLRQGITDGCEIISDFTAVSLSAPASIALAGYGPDIAIGAAAVVSDALDIQLSGNDPLYAGVRAWISVDAKDILVSGSDPVVVIGSTTGSNYYNSYVKQVYGYRDEVYPDWWAD